MRWHSHAAVVGYAAAGSPRYRERAHRDMRATEEAAVAELQNLMRARSGSHDVPPTDDDNGVASPHGVQVTFAADASPRGEGQVGGTGTPRFSVASDGVSVSTAENDPLRVQILKTCVVPCSGRLVRVVYTWCVAASFPQVRGSSAQPAQGAQRSCVQWQPPRCGPRQHAGCGGRNTGDGTACCGNVEHWSP